MQFTKSPPELVQTLESVVPGQPAQTRKMFGYPRAFANGSQAGCLCRGSIISYAAPASGR